MEALRLVLLGNPTFSLGEAPIANFRYRKAEALLCYLAVTGRPHNRSALVGLLWGDLPEASAQSNLRRVLTSLRRLVGSHLLITRQTVAFNQESPYWSDVAEFEARVGGAAADIDITRLNEGLKLYQGDFLEGFYVRNAPDFEAWLLAERGRLRELARQGLHTLATHYTQQGDHAAAIDTTRRLLGLDPWREEAHQQLMRLLAYSGQRSAALAQYDTCRHILADELGVEPSEETIALYERIHVGELSRGTEKHRRGREPVTGHRPLDWGEAPRNSVFYGRQAELAELEQWLVGDRCRLVAILGMGGQGKTSLAVNLTQPLADLSSITANGETLEASFGYIIWRSLLNAPPLADILRALVQFLSDQQVTDLPASLDERLALLFDYLRRQRCLLILDNVEAILQKGDRAGYYRSGYEAYGQLIRRMGEVEHQSCLLLTSREKPKGFAPLERDTSLVRSYHLAGLPVETGHEILAAQGLTGSDETVAALVQHYSGNPLALRLVSETIQDLFEGNIDQFLAEETFIFDDIRDVLDQQFARLSALERRILIWLAIEREEISVQALWENLVRQGSKRAFLEALRSLQRRSLLEKIGDGFTLQNVVMEYTTDRLVEAVCREVEEFSGRRQESGGAEEPLPRHINRYALLKAQAKDYIRESQLRLILQPVAARLLTTLGQAGIEDHFKYILGRLRQVRPHQPGYAGGNILNLLLYLKSNLSGYDFSGLTVWHAYLGGLHLSDVNFAGADLAGTVFTDTFGAISSVAFSPNGKLLAAGTAEGQIRLWRTMDGQPLLTWKGHTNWVMSVAFSPDGQTLATCSDDHIVRLWAVQTGQSLKTLPGHTSGIRSVVFSPDGKTLASGDDDHMVRLWDVNTGQSLKMLSGHTDRVWSVAFSPDGQTLASGSLDQTVRLWDVNAGQSLRTLTGHTSSVWSVAFSPDGQTLASGSNDQTVRLWDVKAGQSLKTLTGHTGWIRTVAFSPAGQTLASGSFDQTVRLWDVNADQSLKTLTGHTNTIRSVAFSPDGQTLASGSFDHTVRLWDVKAGQGLKTLSGHAIPVWSVAFSPDGRTLASGSFDQTVRLWDVNTGQSLKTLTGHTGWVLSVAFSPDGRTLASGSEDQTVRLWDVNTGQSLKTLTGTTSGWVGSVIFSPDGQTLASGGDDQTVRLWDVKAGQSLKTLPGTTTGWVKSVTFSPDGRTLASGSDDQAVRLWDVNTGQRLKTLTGHTSTIRSVAFSPNGKTLASGSDDHTIRLWDVNARQELKTLTGHTSGVTSVAFSPDTPAGTGGQILASGSDDHTIRLWDVANAHALATGQSLNTLSGHTSSVFSVTFSPDGRLLASGSVDETIKLWEVQTGKFLKTLRPPRPYERMNITGVIGLTEAQKASLKALGAVED